jgi:peroxiredoxin
MSTRNPHLSPSPHPFRVGDSAPDFTLLDQDRKEWKLSEAIAKGDVVLCFVPLAFTGVCGTEMGCISKDAEKWGKAGVTVVGVNCDSFATNKAWAAKEGYSHTILADMHREVCKAYGLYWADLNVAQRGTYVLTKGPNGAVVKHVEAREPGKAMDWERVLAMVGE